TRATARWVRRIALSSGLFSIEVISSLFFGLCGFALRFAVGPQERSVDGTGPSCKPKTETDCTVPTATGEFPIEPLPREETKDHAERELQSNRGITPC